MQQQQQQPELSAERAAVLCVDLQRCYYQPPITQLFPQLQERVTRLLAAARARHLPVLHVREVTH